MSIDETIDAIELYDAEGWTDGLPLMPPTRAPEAHVVAVQRADAVIERLVAQFVAAP